MKNHKPNSPEFCTECLGDEEWYEQNAKFEEWAKEHEHDLFVDDYGEYEDWTTRKLWEAWQSSYIANRSLPNLNTNTGSGSGVTPLAKRKIRPWVDVGGYAVMKDATVLVNDVGHAAIVNYGGAFYWVENKELAREYSMSKEKEE